MKHLIACALLCGVMHAARAADADTGVQHVVLCWLNTPGDDAQAAEVIRVSKELASVPGLRSLHAGRVLPSEREIVDDSFDVGVVMDFESPEAMEAYLVNPEHVRRVNETLRPLCGRVRVHDFRY